MGCCLITRGLIQVVFFCPCLLPLSQDSLLAYLFNNKRKIELSPNGSA